MAATMDHETISTTAPDTMESTSKSEGKGAISNDSHGDTVGGNRGSVEVGEAATENGKNSTDAKIQDIDSRPSAVSSVTSGLSPPTAVSASPQDLKVSMESGNARESKIADVKIDSGKKGFKLPGLPLPTKPLVKKIHMPFVRNIIEVKSNDSHDSGATSQSTTLQSRTKSEEATYKTDSKAEGGFAFPKPKLADSTKTAKPPQSSDKSSGDVSESPAADSTAATQPLSAEKKQREKSPADESLTKAPPLPYKEPSWSGVPTEEYHLEVLKGGTIVSKIALNDKAYHVFGRLETCDVPLEHPSLSRYHLVLQYRSVGDSQHDPGFYLYDLGSTHGSWFNKQQVEGRVFYRMRVGHMFKLGGSTRMYILQGPSEDQEAESDLSVKELRELRQQQLNEVEERKRLKQLEEESDADLRREGEGKEYEVGITWGMDYEDADDEDTTGDNPFAIMTQDEKEATYIKDPKKALRGYFDREGYDLEYSVEERESGFTKQFVCKVELPIDDASGRPMVAEAAVAGKKKESVAACALEACRILDAHGVLRQATHESHKKKAKNWKEDDYYDSDEDTFLDRTGEIEKKRMQRMKKAGVIKEKTQTYESLKSDLGNVEAEIGRLETEMSTGSKSIASSILEDDSLDAFMESIKSGKTVDKAWRARLKLRLIDLRKDRARLSRLVDFARPAAMPALHKPSSSQTSFAALSKKLPMFGSMKGRANLKPKLKPTMPSPRTASASSSIITATALEEEVEEELEEDRPEDLASPPASQCSSHRMDSASPKEEPSEMARVTTVLEPKPKASQSESTKTSPIAPPSHAGPSWPVQAGKRTGEELERGACPREPEASPARQVPGAKKGSWQLGAGEATGPAERAKKKPRVAAGPLVEREVGEQEDKEDFANWMPPTGQTGDGKTHLNAKFGY